MARYQGPGNSFDEAKAVAVDPATGNLYVTGESYGSFTTLAYDRSGNMLWTAVYDGPNGGFDGANAWPSIPPPVTMSQAGAGETEPDPITPPYSTEANSIRRACSRR